MKILFIAPYIYTPEYEEHRRNKTGFGMMVYDIASAVSKCGNKVVVAVNAFGPERLCDGFCIAKNSALKNFLHGNYRGSLTFYSNLKARGASTRESIKNLYYFLNVGYLKYIIKKEKPNIVHIHGCSMVISETIAVCREQSVPFVITLHGLLEEDASAGDYLKWCERNLIKHYTGRNTPLTVISTKMKERFLSAYYCADSNETVTVITNGIDVKRKEKTVNIREKLGIGEDKKIILSVGSVCELKNQIQTVRAFSQLQEREEDTVLVFVGTILLNYKILEEVERLNLKDKVFFAGFVPRDELHSYYSVATLNVIASVTEGFGLSMIEGFVYGIPCIAFSDLDAIGDIYDNCAMLLCTERSDAALADTIHRALSKSWNEEQIMEHSKKFSLEAMAEKYNTVYKSLTKKMER